MTFADAGGGKVATDVTASGSNIYRKYYKADQQLQNRIVFSIVTV